METATKQDLYVSRADLSRLEALIARARRGADRDTGYLDHLEACLDLARSVPATDVARDIVTMNTRLRLRNRETDASAVYTLVFPENADADRNRISVLAPLGVALLGAREGDTVVWRTPAGEQRMTIEAILYQPETAGDYHL